MSSGHPRTPDEADTPALHGYPPAAQIMGQLINAVFLDVIDEDVTRMERMNEMISKLDASQRNGFKPIDLFVMRPSMDLGKIAAEHEKYLPRNLKILTRALGHRVATSRRQARPLRRAAARPPRPRRGGGAGRRPRRGLVARRHGAHP